MTLAWPCVVLGICEQAAEVSAVSLFIPGLSTATNRKHLEDITTEKSGTQQWRNTRSAG